MFFPLSSVIFTFSFFIACQAQALKTYELQLHKYLVANINEKYGILEQNFQKGTDKFTFRQPVNSTSKDGMEIEITYKDNFKFDGVYFCRQEKMNEWKELARKIFLTGFVGGTCPFPKDKPMLLKDKFSIKSKLKEDISGTVFISIYLSFYDAMERTGRYDVIGTAKAI